MDRARPAPLTADQPFSNPWPFLCVGLVASVAALLLSLIAHDHMGPVRAGLLVAGLLATGVAVTIRPGSVVVVGLASLAGFVAAGAMDEWDSARLMVRVLATVAALAAVLLLAPRFVRRLVVSLLILFHFGGILTAVTSVPPNPWLSMVLWAHVYRPYLEFMYLNNAYHFYSPDPGPATLAWFRVEYEDRSARWVKIPNRADYPLAINYQRRLSLTESINQLSPQPAPQMLQQLLLRRHQAGQELGIPMHPDMPEALQFREPVMYSKKMLEAYARHAAVTYKHLDDPAKKVIGVKIYRIVHGLPEPSRVATAKGKLDDETMYLAYYQGEFDPDGNLKDPTDPFLYWLIPILKVPREHALRNGPLSPGEWDDPEKVELRNYVEIHARDKKAR